MNIILIGMPGSGKSTVGVVLANFSDRGVVIAAGMTLADLYAARKPLYEKYADITVCAEGGTVWDTARRIAEALRAR